ncbi:MAG: hypothetical protein RR232_01850 [Clostridia bacterium]
MIKIEKYKQPNLIRTLKEHPYAALTGAFMIFVGFVAGCSSAISQNDEADVLAIINEAKLFSSAGALSCLRITMFALLLFCAVYAALIWKLLLPISAIALLVKGFAAGMAVCGIIRGNGIIGALDGAIYILLPCATGCMALLMGFIHSTRMLDKNKPLRVVKSMPSDDIGLMWKNLALLGAGLMLEFAMAFFVSNTF